MPIRILSVNKRLRNLGRIQFLQNLHLYTQKSVCATSTRPFGEVGGKSPLQLSSRTHIAKIEAKKLLRKIRSKNLTAGVFFFRVLRLHLLLQFAVSDLVFHCLPMSHKKDARLIGVKGRLNFATLQTEDIYLRLHLFYLCSGKASNVLIPI